MKVDKEYLAKHHFWFLLAAYAPMVLLGLILLWTSVAGAIDGEANKIKALKDEVKKFAKADVKNKTWIEAFREKAGELAKKKNDVWGEVWQGQSAIFTWPEPLAELQSLEYGEDIRENQKRDIYINDKDCYSKQVRDLIAVVQPVNEKGEGVVQYRGSWKGVLNFVPKWFGDRSGPLVVPSSEEIWLAQEDLWIQRELLQVIRDTNDGLALYEKVKTPPKPARDEIDRQVFENLRWRLELGITKDEIRWRVTNRSPRQQTLALTFRLTFKPKRTQDLWVDGEPLAPNQSSKEVVVKFPGFVGLKGIDSVEQVLDWRTAPVKRIDQLRLAYNAHSTTGKPLLPFPKFAPKDDDPSRAPAAPGGMQGGMQGAMPMPGPPMMPGGERPGGVRGGNDMGLERNRYIETSDQVRRMPVALVLIVDQSHVQDVLTAFAKSRLRFQTTQVEWKRYRGSIQPAVEEEGKVAEGPVGPGRPRRPPMAPPGVIGNFRPPPMVKPGVNPQEPADNDEDSSNLVEMALYGITSLYAKYPPKPPAGEAPANPAPAAPAPAAPAPTTPPPAAPAPVVPAPAPTTPAATKQ
jgi:hypothetical protein